MPSVKRAAVVTHGSTRNVSEALERLRAISLKCGVTLEDAFGDAPHTAEIAVALGGDGTMLRALTRFLGTGVAVIGVNFGRVGFLTSIPRPSSKRGSSGSSPATTRSRCFQRSRSRSAPSAKARSTTA